MCLQSLRHYFFIKSYFFFQPSQYNNFYLYKQNILFRISIDQIGKNLKKTRDKLDDSILHSTEKNIKGKISVNFRILFDYLQMVSIIQNVRFQWPIYLTKYLKVYSYLSFTNQFFSFDCFTYEYEISISPVFLKLIFAQMTPFFNCAIFILYFCLFQGKKSEKDIKLTKAVIVIFVVFTYSQLSAINKLFEMISCDEINNVSYLNIDFHFVCWTNEHQYWVRNFFLLTFILFLRYY